MKNKVHLILFAAGLIILTFLIRDFGPENILINIERLGWWFAAAAGLWGIVYLENAAAWYVIMGYDRRKVAFWRVYTISLSSFAINYVTPFLSLGGEPYRISAIREFVGLERSVSSVTLYRMLHILAHLFFWVLTIPLSYILLPEIHKYTAALLLFFLIVSLLILFLFYGLKKGFLYALYNITGRYRFLKFIYRKAERHSAKLKTIDLQIKELYNSRKEAFWMAVLLELLSRFTASIEFYFILTAIGYDVSIPHAFYIHSISSLFMNIFFFMPLEMGSREGGLFLAFQAFSIRPEAAIFVGLVNRLREICWIIIGVILIQINNRRSRQRVKLNLTDLRGDV